MTDSNPTTQDELVRSVTRTYPVYGVIQTCVTQRFPYLNSTAARGGRTGLNAVLMDNLSVSSFNPGPLENSVLIQTDSYYLENDIGNNFRRLRGIIVNEARRTR